MVFDKELDMIVRVRESDFFIIFYWRLLSVIFLFVLFIIYFVDGCF